MNMKFVPGVVAYAKTKSVSTGSNFRAGLEPSEDNDASGRKNLLWSTSLPRQA